MLSLQWKKFYYFSCFFILLSIALCITFRYSMTDYALGLRNKRIHYKILKHDDPQSVLNPRSAFYGLVHKDTYGHPVRTWSRTLKKQEKEKLSFFFPELASTSSPVQNNVEWKQYFPKLVNVIMKHRYQIRKMNRTLFTKSVVLTVVGAKSRYKVGDVFKAVFYTRDNKGRRKTFGGDYFRARLIDRNTTATPDGVPCRVIDNEDGFYTITAPIVFEGRFKLDLELVMSVEAIYMALLMARVRSRYYAYVAVFDNGETKLCDMLLASYLLQEKYARCDYSNPRNQEPWFCVRPFYGPCLPITYMYYNKHGFEIMNFTKVCQHGVCQLPMITSILINAVRNLERKESKVESLQENIPECKQMFLKKGNVKGTKGFFKNRRWVSLECKNKLKTIQKISTCLKDKTVYFLGDSSVRYFFHLIIDKLWLQVDGPNNNITWQQPKIAYDNPLQRNNITLYFRAHGPPLQNSGPPSSRPYISDTILGLPVGGPEVFVIFTIGVHLLSYRPHFYIHRLNGIKDAIVSHHRKFPDTRFIVKGFTVVARPFEWFLLRYNRILEDTFKDMKSVVFLDLWDFSTVWSQRELHPLPININEQALFMLSYLCS